MNRNQVAFIAVVATGLGGCSIRAGGAGDVGASLGGTQPAAEANGSDPSTTAFVRIANLGTLGAGPFDVCLRVRGCDSSAPFDIGPLFEQQVLSDGLD